MYICMCNWVPMLYSGKKKSVLGERTIKNKLKKRKKKEKKEKLNSSKADKRKYKHHRSLGAANSNHSDVLLHTY